MAEERNTVADLRVELHRSVGMVRARLCVELQTLTEQLETLILARLDDSDQGTSTRSGSKVTDRNDALLLPELPQSSMPSESPTYQYMSEVTARPQPAASAKGPMMEGMVSNAGTTLPPAAAEESNATSFGLGGEGVSLDDDDISEPTGQFIRGTSPFPSPSEQLEILDEDIALAELECPAPPPISPTFKSFNKSCRSVGVESRCSGSTKFVQWLDWEQESIKPSERRPSFRSIVSMRTGSRLFDMNTLRSGDVLESTLVCWRKVMCRPSSKRKLTWDIFSVFVLGYDLLVLPMTVFEAANLDCQHLAATLTNVFWTCDILFNFLTGYHNGGIVEMRPGRVAQKYLRTWFLVDFFVVAVEWTLFYLTSMQTQTGIEHVGMARIIKLSRYHRVMRFIRMVRVWKLVGVVDTLTSIVCSIFPTESLVIVLGVMKLTVGIALLNHFIACAWYAIGTMNGVDGDGHDWDSWVRNLEPQWDRSLWYTYTTSLHWSLTQLTPASMEVQPRNATERAFTIFVIISALVMFSSFVSMITQAMMHLRHLNAERTRQQDMVRQYISENHVTLDIANRIQSFMRKHYAMTRCRIRQSDIPSLSSMPESLRIELNCDVFMPIMNPHPFFHQFIHNDHTAIVNCCHYILEEKSILIGQEACICGDVATEMLFLVSGEMDYMEGVDNILNGKVTAGQRAVEMVLWLQWSHMGRLMANTNCALVAVPSRAFREMMRDASDLSLMCCKAYAVWYLQAVVAAQERGVLNDVWEEHDVLQEAAQRAFEFIDSAVAETKPQQVGRWIMRRLSPQFLSQNSVTGRSVANRIVDFFGRLCGSKRESDEWLDAQECRRTESK